MDQSAVKMSAMKKILHIYGRLQRGGAEMMTLEIMRCLEKRQFEFSFCVLSGLPGELDEEIRSLGGHIIYLRLGLGFPFRFARLLAEGRYDVVHSHVHMFSGFLLMIAALKKVPVRIVHFHSVVSTTSSNRESFVKQLQNGLMRLLIDRFGTDLIAVCQAVRDQVWCRRPYLKSTCRVIYNGVKQNLHSWNVARDVFTSEFGIPKNDWIFIHVGSMSPAKNHERLIHIFKQIVSRHKNSCLVLVGREEPVIKARIQEAIMRFGLADKVRFAGERSDVPRLLRGADLMIFPSLWEGLPVSVLEACAAATPVVASDLPGIREIALHAQADVACISLAVSDEHWAEAIISVLDGCSPVPSASCADISATVFGLDQQIRSLSGIWARQTG